MPPLFFWFAASLLNLMRHTLVLPWQHASGERSSPVFAWVLDIAGHACYFPPRLA